MIENSFDAITSFSLGFALDLNFLDVSVTKVHRKTISDEVADVP